MNKRMSTLCIAAILFTAINSFGQEFIPGKMWLDCQYASRFYFVWGLTEGQALILEELKMKSTKNLKWVISSDDVPAITDIISQFYNDSANTYIPWKYMAFVAKMKLEGQNSTKIEEQLEMLRQYAMYERGKKKKD
jgi:hypothetical protein